MVVDQAIAAVADRQHGIVTRSQLQRLGLARGGIRSRIRRGLLHPLFDGAYVWARPIPTPVGRSVAGVYACGEGSVLTRHAAAACWGFRPEPTGPIDVTVVGDRRVRTFCPVKCVWSW